MTQSLLQMSGVVADLIYTVDAVPTAGQEATSTSFQIAPGGGFNAMVAARRTGISVSYAGSVGTGPFAQMVLDGLTAEDIPVLRARDSARDQGCCTVMVDAAGERTFITSDGAEGFVTRDDLAQINPADFDWTLLSGYALHYPNSRTALGDWLRRETALSRLVFDPCPVVATIAPDLIRAAMDRALWVSANAKEAAVLTGHDDPQDAAVALGKSRPDGGGALVRIGEEGCILAVGSTVTKIPAHRVQAVDTNGAGDAHIGSFIGMLAETNDPLLAGQYANIAAALSTTLHGPATAPQRSDVDQILTIKRAV